MINTQQLGRVALLVGGQSTERSISLVSGKRVGEALAAQGITFDKIDVGLDIIDQLRLHHYDRAMIVLHGVVGEDGTIQSLLELMQIPYTGPSPLACAISMDKVKTKKIWQSAGIPTAPHCCVDEEDVDAFIEQHSFPLIVKPINSGSSWGVSKVIEQGQLAAAIDKAAQYGPVMIERCIEGDEYTVSIVDQDVLPPLRLRSAKEVCDFDAKYCDQSTKHEFFTLQAQHEDLLKDLSMKAFKAIGGSGTCRVDWMQDASNGQFYALEINAIPGMTYTSMMPDAAEAHGWTFAELCLRILTIARCHTPGLAPSEHGKLGKQVLQKQGIPSA
jgi:D-alanine-D-alanine ligase